MHVFRHPKYYTELRKRNKSDQAISNPRATAGDGSVRPGPGLKPKETSCPFDKTQAGQDARRKPQAPRHKPQASSHKRQAP